MRAVIQDRYGDVDVLRLAEVERPVPRDGEVLVRVQAAGAHIGDWRLMRGQPMIIRPAVGLRAPRPRLRVRGEALAGIVEAVGPGVTDVSVGDAVVGTGIGAHAEFAIARADRLVPKPPSLGWDEAAAVPTSSVTALQALRDLGEVRPGQRVLIIGATGGVGSYATQLAVAMGAQVTAVCSAGNADLARSLGAHDVIDYAAEDPTDPAALAAPAAGRRFDVILDVVGNRSIGDLRRVLTDDGTLVLVATAPGGRWLGGVDRFVQAAILSRFVRHRLRPLASVDRAQDVAVVLDHIEAGRVRPVIDRTFPLEQVPDALAYVGQGHSHGKVVITIRA